MTNRQSCCGKAGDSQPRGSGLITSSRDYISQFIWIKGCKKYIESFNQPGENESIENKLQNWMKWILLSRPESTCKKTLIFCLLVLSSFFVLFSGILNRLAISFNRFCTWPELSKWHQQKINCWELKVSTIFLHST